MHGLFSQGGKINKIVKRMGKFIDLFDLVFVCVIVLMITFIAHFIDLNFDNKIDSNNLKSGIQVSS